MRRSLAGRMGELAASARTLAARPSRGAKIRDVLLWMLFAFMVWFENSAKDQLRASWLEVGGILLLLAGAVAVSRAAPLVALAAVELVNLVQVLVHPPEGATSFLATYVVILFVMSYLAGRRLARAREVSLSFVAMVGIGLLIALLLGADHGNSYYWLINWLWMVVMLVLASVIPWLFGRYRRQRGELLSSGWQRAEQLEREQRIIADQVRLRERSRIAQDMHDSLGHELSLIALRAGALEVAPDLDDKHRQAAGSLRQSAAVATERLREIIGVLREDTQAAPMEPAHESIDELVERARASGMAVEMHRESDRVELVPMVDRAAHRVVQEALTNATKHAPGAAVTVRIIQSTVDTLVTVTNDPPPAGPLPGRSQGHHGLVGLRERVRLVGGTLVAGPHEGGFQVSARLPHASEAVKAADPELGERSESAHQLEYARRRARRGLIAVITVPAAIGAALLVLVLGVYLFATVNSALPATVYRELTLGQSRDELQSVLPGRQAIERPTRTEPPIPDGATCEYYRASANPFELDPDTYRLCFVAGRLASKDLLYWPTPRSFDPNREDRGVDPSTAGR